MYISEILSYDEDDYEAELYISDGEYSLLCYAYTIKSFTVNQKVNGICGLLCEDIVKSFEQNYNITKLSQYYAYLLTAKVISTEKSIVKIGNLIIYLDKQLPNDIIEGEYISFRVQRLDLLR